MQMTFDSRSRVGKSLLLGNNKRQCYK